MILPTQMHRSCRRPDLETGWMENYIKVALGKIPDCLKDDPIIRGMHSFDNLCRVLRKMSTVDHSIRDYEAVLLQSDQYNELYEDKKIAALFSRVSPLIKVKIARLIVDEVRITSLLNRNEPSICDLMYVASAFRRSIHERDEELAKCATEEDRQECINKTWYTFTYKDRTEFLEVLDDVFR